MKTKLILSLTLLLMIAAAVRAQETASVDGEGFIRNWPVPAPGLDLRSRPETVTEAGR